MAIFTSSFLFARLAHGGTPSAAVPASLGVCVWSSASYSSKIFYARPQSPAARQPILALSEGIRPVQPARLLF